MLRYLIITCVVLSHFFINVNSFAKESVNSTHSESWHQHWENAVLKCSQKKFSEAEIEFSKAVEILERSKDHSHPHVYVDRGRLYLLIKKFPEALVDINKAIESNNLQGNDIYRALSARMCIYGALGKVEESRADYDQLIKLGYPFPKFEEYEDKYIIRNVPDSEVFKDAISTYYLETGLCDQIEDIKFYDSGIGIIKKSQKKKACPCHQLGISKAKAIQICKQTCATMSVTYQMWCENTFSSNYCKAICLSIVYGLTETCHYCCAEGNFYQQCIQPFEHILQKIGNRCDPSWD